MAELDDERTALDAANEMERKIQLEGRENPDQFKMPDGSTLAQTRQNLAEIQKAEGESDALANRKSTIALGRTHDIPLDESRIIMNKDTGQVSIARIPTEDDKGIKKDSPTSNPVATAVLPANRTTPEKELLKEGKI